MKTTKKWRCFHCDEVFTNEADARLHFGPSCDRDPACQVDAKHLRDLETELARYRSEDTDLHRQIEHLKTEHSQALMRAEEAGYAKGLKDGRELATPGALMIADERRRQIEAEGWTAEHDDKHDAGELICAALIYAGASMAIKAGDQPADLQEYYRIKESALTWPWDFEWLKLSPDPKRNLVKAGALIAAELDRQLLEEKSERRAKPTSVPLTKCPQCGESLVQANTDGTQQGLDTYCEECGWPDENRPAPKVEGD